ncbi:MAG: ribonuclease R [Bacteroidales bacterium]|nr:ribonuclease R [Bacteroidales bacterium]
MTKRNRKRGAQSSGKKSAVYGMKKSRRRTGMTMGRDAERRAAGLNPRGKRAIEEIEGILEIASGGYGFVRRAPKEDERPGAKRDQREDVFIPIGKMRGALNNDKVRVAILKKNEEKGSEGEVICVVERSTRPWVGLMQITGKHAWVIIENKSMPYDVEVPYDSVQKEWQGMKVAVLVKEFPRGFQTPVGEVVDVLGKPGDNDTEMHAILSEYGLPYKFPAEVEAEAEKIPKKITAKDLEGRKDLRKDCIFTIDPADAKDFDDAVSYKVLDNGHLEIGIHIADVSYYVKPQSIIDKEAYARATSVYLVDRTIPMLPEALSNNLCSLRPNEDKLCFSAIFEMDAAGKVYSQWFGRSVINSSFRFAYEEAQQIIDNNGDMTTYTPVMPEGKIPSQEVITAVLELHKLASVLRKKRFQEGSISFERPEMKVLVDETGKPIDVVQKVTKSANWLIEEYMLLANKAVATYVSTAIKKQAPTFVYRIHDEPNMEKVAELKTFVKYFGYRLEAENPGQLAKSLNKLVEQIHGKPECDSIELMALRCMARAQYSTDNIGHYGLGFRYYTHFTSPIRRYPDMMVHRLLSRYLEGGKSADKQAFEDYCQHSSQREQIATEAERSSVKYKMAEYMKERVGEVYEGTVSGVTEWGIYVQVEPTHIEGMVALRELTDDYYQFDEKRFCVTGKSSGRRFMLGDKVKVRVERASLEQKNIDFSLVIPEGEKMEDYGVFSEEIPEKKKKKSSKKRK